MNAQMFNSFMDGTKSAIEMAAVANACDLAPARGGLAFPPGGSDALAESLRPKAVGGVLERKGQVEVISSLGRDGSAVPRVLRWGGYVGVEATSGQSGRCVQGYGHATVRGARSSDKQR